MLIKFNEEKPIFIQISEWIEDAILQGVYNEEEQIPSITEFSVNCKINPATALKGINILVDEGILYKKRGLGMFVAENAVEKLMEKRREQFYTVSIDNLVTEAIKLNIPEDVLIKKIERRYANEKH